MRINYNNYIKSKPWFSRHSDWLRRSNHACSMFPWVIVGKRYRGQYRRYHCHHMNYSHLGSEKLWRDVVVLCPFAHDFVIHGLLAGFKRPSQQRYYPNFFQRAAHFWCCLPVVLKGAVLFCLCVGIFFVGVVGIRFLQ